MYSGRHFDPNGRPLNEEEWQARRDEFLPAERDRAWVRNLMSPHVKPGEIANWIARPSHGIRGLPFEFEYVRREE
jgi:benzoyl-CoA 2,3-dioxygenase component B